MSRNDKIKDMLDEYISNEKFTYETCENGSVFCYYIGDEFLEIDGCNKMWINGVNGIADLSNYKESDTAYRLFYASEIMLRIVGILDDSGVDEE